MAAQRRNQVTQGHTNMFQNYVRPSDPKNRAHFTTTSSPLHTNSRNWNKVPSLESKALLGMNAPGSLVTRNKDPVTVSLVKLALSGVPYPQALKKSFQSSKAFFHSIFICFYPGHCFLALK